MIVLIHQKTQQVLKVLKGIARLEISSANCTEAFWELAEKFPDEIIAWCEEKYVNDLNMEQWPQIFHHDLIMASYSIENVFLPDSIGYIDQLPFVNVNRKILYGTWQMSSDVGGIKGDTLLRFKPLLKNIKDFNPLLNSIAKLGQQNGLFCYSAPHLVKKNISPSRKYIASDIQLFHFVNQHYKTIRTIILLWCLFRYERRLPILAFIKSIFVDKLLNKHIDLRKIEVNSTKIFTRSNSLDVIIPTMGRSMHLLQVVKDLSLQSLLPKKLIIVEQNPDTGSVSELDDLNEYNWPFEIKHFFIHKTGACNARNIALQNVTSDWVFFCDDDNRIEKDIIQNALSEIKRLGANMVSTAYRQMNEPLVFKHIKQWGTFGAGNSIVARSYIEGITFSSIFEHGYGEDKDFGMQLRNAGCDIIYHPEIEILHLKAPMGGFRQKPKLLWEMEKQVSKPSPTLMALAIRYYTKEQIVGFKTSLYLKYYDKQSVKNPFSYIREMNKSWHKSEKWAKKLINSEKGIGDDFQVITEIK
ncbi:glycosyltransferase family 2 protein [Gillisia hiemivivida]|uniref:Glycosyltransferase family 2 protein n=1 Tax=Gillisia hiemivivida TaxID=291190 RepID=A0A5C6ZSS7_9FLAO|nr:glycosyltransferase family A protein [Gillisia hiemivivida]TXD93897.1 glycosyltransferase family 2 protein [Gillisia hiemivivida]